MIVSMLKKMCVLSLVIMLCVSQISAKDNRKACALDKELKKFSWGCTDTKRKFNFNRDCKAFKEVLDQLLNNKIRFIKSELGKKFSEQNRLVCNKTEFANNCLKEFFGFQQKVSDDRLKDFLLISFDDAQNRIEEFVVHKMFCLKSALCDSFKVINCSLDLLACKVDDLNSDADCLAEVLFEYITIANGVAIFNGSLDPVIALAEVCLAAGDDCLVACCVEEVNECGELI